MDRIDFATFFREVHGHHPYAWQERLLDTVLEGGWPDQIVAPTGAGKTSVIDVHVFATALSAAGRAPRLPRRLLLVVDRRAVVDSHDEHARAVAQRLAGRQPEPVCAQVAHLLAGLRLDVPAVIREVIGSADRHADLGEPSPDGPLVTARLRGGTAAPRSWRDAPEACAVLTGTPDMIGSRLLLQGYASSRRAWPREAGLLVFDTALIVDEAHLSRQFLRTARRVAELAQGRVPVTGDVPTLQVVATTATPHEGDGRSVGVGLQDLNDPALGPRMTRPKPVELLELPTWPPGPKDPKALRLVVERAKLLHHEAGTTIGVVVNRVETAVALAQELARDGLRSELLVGRMRPADVDLLRRHRPGLLTTEGNPDVDVLVATQTVEVGLDLDVAAMITELAPGSALAQRSGRLNRRGLHEQAPFIVLVPTDRARLDKESKPYDAADLHSGLDWIIDRSVDPQGMAPWAVRQNPPPTAALRRTLLRRLELTDAWAWARTSDEPFCRPDLDLWLSDDISPERDVWVVAREDLPSDPASAVRVASLLPPMAHELFAVPIHDAVNLVERWQAQEAAGQADLPPVLVQREGSFTPISQLGHLQRTALQGADDDAVIPERAYRPRPGDVLIVDAGRLTHRQGVLDPSGRSEPVFDVLDHLPGDPTSAVRHGSVRLRWGTLLPRLHDDEAASLPGSLRSHLPRPIRALLAMGPQGAVGRWSRSQLGELADLLEQVEIPQIRTSDSAASSAHRTDLQRMRQAACALLRGRVKDIALTVLNDPAGEPALLVVLDARRAAADEDVRQTWTPSESAVPLNQHATAVATASERLGAALGLGSITVERLRLAGLHHDAGKADPRFQRLLGRAADGPLLAKSASRPPLSDAGEHTAAGLPAGWRHEQLSALYAWLTVAEPDRDLVSRLAGTTHGHGRCGFPHGAGSLLGEGPAPCWDPPLEGDELQAQAVRLFDIGEWEAVVQRTDREHGVWALAYLESVLRAADGRVSGAGS